VIPSGTEVSGGIGIETGVVVQGKTRADAYTFKITITVVQYDLPGQSFYIASLNPPGGMVSASYSYPLSAVNYNPPYTWSVISGTMPDGLFLDSVVGIIAGMPSTFGVFNFIIQASELVGDIAAASLSIDIGVSG
jgi:hypothetical protein